MVKKFCSVIIVKVIDKQLILSSLYLFFCKLKGFIAFKLYANSRILKN